MSPSIALQLALFGELASERAAREREERAFLCLDCDVDTIEIREYYAIHDPLWLQANPGIAGMLCIGCAESRLGRMLSREDFADAPCNRWCERPVSARLESRLTSTRSTSSKP